MGFKTAFKLILIFFLLLAIPATVYESQRQQELQKRAAGVPTVLTVDLADVSVLPRIWQYLAQGGEVPIPQLPPVVSPISTLSPRYIRIDHVFDAYEVVKRDQAENIVYDFSLLDKEVDAILQMGAIPFFSLSYIPPLLEDPTNHERIASLAQWQTLVGETVAHYSSKKGKDLKDVFYEVYNEPDLFGRWSLSEYLALYEATVVGAEDAKAQNRYLIGGPALSYFNKNFVASFLAFAQTRGIRIDFVSWHVYDRNPNKIASDAQALDVLLSDKPAFGHVLKVVSEWGSIPEKHIWHDTILDNSHVLATVSKALGSVDQLFYFEIKDSEYKGQEAIGGWGILGDDERGLRKKPRFFALSLLNTLKPLRFRVLGENDNIYAIASGDNRTNLRILLTYYSIGQSGSPVSIPIRLTNIPTGTYEVRKSVLGGSAQPRYEESIPLHVTKNEGLITVDIASDNLVALDIVRTSSAAAYTLGESGLAQDRAASVSAAIGPLTYDLSVFPPAKITRIEFSFLPSLTLGERSENVLFESVMPGVATRLTTGFDGFSNVLTASIVDSNGITYEVSLPLLPEFWKRWHKVVLFLDSTSRLLSLSIDETTRSTPFSSEATPFATASFATLFEGAIDNVAVSFDGTAVLTDGF